MPEKRRFKRLPKKSKVRYKIIEFSDKEKPIKEAIYKNVGGGGILFETDEMLPIGTILKVEFDLQGWHKFFPGFIKPEQTSISEPIVAVAQVVRVEEIEKNKKYEIGIKFVNIDEFHQRSVIEFIESKMKEE